MNNWIEKYLAEFRDNNGLLWIIKISEKDYVGDIIPLLCTGHPLTFEFTSNSDSIYARIIETQVRIRVWSSENFSLADLYSADSMHFKVDVFYHYDQGISQPLPIPQFSGYVDCGLYEEPYEDVPYEVTITACCGLKYLQELPYVDSSGLPYDGRQKESDIIFQIIEKIGRSRFGELINIYEESMDDGEGDSPIEQVSIDNDVFRGMTCYDVLDMIMIKWGATIRQLTDTYYIYRAVEMAKGGTVYSRLFPAPGQALASGGWEPLRNISRRSKLSHMRQVPGGVQMIVAPARRIALKHDYGYKDSWIDNWDFREASYDYANSVWQFWSKGAGWAKFTVPGEAEGAVFQNHSLPPGGATIWLSQTFARHAISSNDIIVFSFDYIVINYSGSEQNGLKAYIKIQSDDGQYLRQSSSDENEYEWHNSNAFIEIDVNAGNGKNPKQTFSRYMPDCPEGNYTITLWGLITPQPVYILYKNLKFYATSDKIEYARVKKIFRPVAGNDLPIQKWINKLIKKTKWIDEKSYQDFPEVVEHEWVATNNIYGVEIEQECLLGDVTKSGAGGVDIDNVLEQFAGALSVGKGKLSDAASNFVSTHAAAYLPIVVTSEDNKIIFTAGTAGVDFVGYTSINKILGSLAAIVHTIPNHVLQPQIDRILIYLIEGTVSGRADVGTEGGVKEMVFDTDIETTVDNFISDNASAFASINGITLSKQVDGSDVYLVLTEITAGMGFTAEITRTSGGLEGTVQHEWQQYTTAQKRVDTIFLTGLEGEIKITVNTVERSVIAEKVDYSFTEKWNTRGGVESKELLSILADEMADQYSRPRQLIQMAIRDMNREDVSLLGYSLMGSYEDPVNKIDGKNRRFVLGNGRYEVKERFAMMDFKEVKYISAPVVLYAYVADNARNKIVLIYDQWLDESSVPSKNDFVVTDFSVSGVTVVKEKVTLTVSDDYILSDVITVSYNPDADPIRGADGLLEAGKLTMYPVENRISGLKLMQ